MWCTNELSVMRKIIRKTNTYNPLIRTRKCVYQRVRNVSFSEKFVYALNAWSMRLLELAQKTIPIKIHS